MREIHVRDLHTELGAQIDETEDMASLLGIRLKMAAIREEDARDVAEHAKENYERAVKELEEATSKRIYWEGQLQKIQTSTQNGTATVSRTYVVRTKGISPEEIDRLIQEKGSAAFEQLEAEGKAEIEWSDQ